MCFDYLAATSEELSEEFKRISDEMGDPQIGTKKEVNYLPEILCNGEEVLGLSSGIMQGNTWLIVLTDQRIIFLDKGFFYGLKQKTIDLDKVNSVSGETGLIFGKIIISDGSGEKTINNVFKKSVKNFTNKVHEAINNRKLPQVSTDFTLMFEILDDLKKSGHFSDEEFDEAKKQILKNHN